jgi:hypothetical protein
MTTADVLNPMQQAVVDALAKEATWEPLPRDIVESLRQRLHDGVAESAEHLTPDNALWVSKHKLTTVHGCEANHLAGLDGFSWTLANVRGTVLHKAVELGANWRGVIVPADVVDAALDHLAEDERESAGPFIYGLPASDRAQLRSNAIDLYTKFDECFPPLKAAWRPVIESGARYEMFERRINLSTKTDLTLGAVGNKVVIDIKSGGIQPSHREELRFYALVEAMRSGYAPRKLATYSLLTARIDVEDVTEGVLEAALRKTVDGIRKMFELQRLKRDPVLTPSHVCSWCPLLDSCATGEKFLTQRDDPDAFEP